MNKRRNDRPGEESAARETARGGGGRGVEEGAGTRLVAAQFRATAMPTSELSTGSAALSASRSADDQVWVASCE